MTNDPQPQNVILNPVEKEIMEKHSEPGPNSFRSTQQEVGRWAQENFGDCVSKWEGHVSEGHPLGSICALLGMVEELGEIAGAVLKRIQGRDKDANGNIISDEEFRSKVRDGISDLNIFESDFCSRENIDIYKDFRTVWEKQVSKRKQATWNADKAKEHPGLLITDTEWPWKIGTLVQKVDDPSKVWEVVGHPNNNIVMIEWRNPGDSSTQRNPLYSPIGYKVVGKKQIDTADNYCNNPVAHPAEDDGVSYVNNVPILGDMEEMPEFKSGTHTGEDWCTHYGINLDDYTVWKQERVDFWDEEITHEEFIKIMKRCTFDCVRIRKWMIKDSSSSDKLVTTKKKQKKSKKK